MLETKILVSFPKEDYEVYLRIQEYVRRLEQDLGVRVSKSQVARDLIKKGLDADTVQQGR